MAGINSYFLHGGLAEGLLLIGLEGKIARSRSLIETARHNVAVTVNAGLTILYWQIGNRIRHDILKEKRAEYGRLIVVTLSRQLVKKFGNGFPLPIDSHGS
ncbi:MAG: DUF1016 N-terminal domain-containing protein [Desulfobacterales bacterium]|nr:DUF1016 N-terminal domain-containing protein [Desulfobacterales bacterium]